MKKEDIIMIICAVTILATTIYLWDNFYGWTRMAWGLWGLAIYIGTIASLKKEMGNDRGN